MSAFWDKVEPMLRQIQPGAVTRFLERNGYVRRGHDAGRASIYAGRGDGLILVPMDRSFQDYPRRIADIIELFSSEGLTFDDVLTLFVLPDSDVLRYRIESPDSAWGSLRLSYSYEAMHALFDVLKYSAAGVSTARTDYRNVSESAQAYARTCRFGQTELGSFVMKVFCPTRPVPVEDENAEPFGRTSTKSAVENFAFIASEESADPKTPLPPTLNRQVASAVNRLKPDSDFGSSFVAIRYLPVVTREAKASVPPIDKLPEPENVQFDLGPFVYSRAQSIRDRLKKAEEYGREVVSGYITDLHKDRPNTKAEQSQQISLEVKYGSSFRKVTMRLLPAEYKLAVAWHDQNQQVRLDAVFDKRGRPWAVTQYFDFAAIGKPSTQGLLFDPPAESDSGRSP